MITKVLRWLSKIERNISKFISIKNKVPMKNINFQEDYSSQLPALRMLINLGYTYLSQEEVMRQRYNRTSNVLLEPILKEQLAKINEIQVSSTQTEKFTQSNIDEAVLRLKEIPFEQGYAKATEYVYDRLLLGTTLDQTIEGNKREYTLQYIDWKNPKNNVYHIAEEFSVLRPDGKKELRPDIVLFVNGISLAIIENKRQDMDDPIGQAISQHIRNEKENGIRKLYVYAQIMMACAVNQAKYGTNATPPKFWNIWREKEFDFTEIENTKHLIPSEEVRRQIMEGRRESEFFGKDQAEQIHNVLTQSFTLIEQDVFLFSIAQPKRLLDLTANFILYDNNIKKIARYQQYFAVKLAIDRLQVFDGEKRQGGVIWHTQGSGKSLTMAMMAHAIARVESIKNPKIILVTDRTDLDQQISKTFTAVGMNVENAKTGKHLIEVLESHSDSVITTIINKFDTAVRGIKEPLTSPNIFVLIDEGHRTQHGTFHVNMQKALPNACYMAFTGTPLFKKDKNTMHKFGGMIDQYTVKHAVEDGAVLPLVYEGRYSDQKVDEEIIDNYFNYVSEDLTEYEKADLKKKFAKSTHIADAEKNIEAIAWDIVRHFQTNFQGATPFKGQIVCNSKRTAVKYFKAIQHIDRVSCALVISAPDDREGEDTAYGESSDQVKGFWQGMMDQYGNAKNYEESIIRQFKHDDHPELIIVVDKLLTGFDAPKNTVLYLTRKLKGHTLLQAIARVNRLYEDKDYGYIIDYAGVISELDDALLTYSDLEDFDEKDLEGTLTSIQKEIEKLDPAHQQVLEFFKDIRNRNDNELFQQKLRHKDIRDDFYKKLASFARILKLAMSSMKFHRETPEKKIERYKNDLKFFMNLRTAVAQRYSDKVDYKIYEGQIQKLLDQHVSTRGINPLTELINIFDEGAFQNELGKTEGIAAKADKIASRTAKHISERMDEDPVFYKKFSQLIQQAIDDFYADRISELEYLERVKDYNEKTLNKTDTSIPEEIRNNQTLSAYFGIVNEFFEGKEVNVLESQDTLVGASKSIKGIIENKKQVNWENNPDIINQMRLEIGDYVYDEIGVKIGMRLNFSEIDEMADRIINVAKTVDRS